MKNSLLSVKRWAMLCWYASIAMTLFYFIILLIPSTISFYYNIIILIPSLLFMGFFFVSALDTKDKPTRYISILSGIGSLGMLFPKVLNIVWDCCEKPEFWLSYEESQYPVYDFCVNNYNLFEYIATIGGILMALYFFYIMRRTNYALKTICIPAIIACLLLGASNLVGKTLFVILVMIITYLLFVFSFYKLYRIL